MKKLFFALIAILCFTTANAQSTADMQKISDLAEKLQKMIDKAPKETGVAEIDKYVNGCKDAGVGALVSYAKIKELQAGSAAPADWVELGKALVTQTTGLADVGKAAVDAGKALKDAPKLKIPGYTKTIKWSADALPVITELLSEETKLVQSIATGK